MRAQTGAKLTTSKPMWDFRVTSGAFKWQTKCVHISSFLSLQRRAFLSLSSFAHQAKMKKRCSHITRSFARSLACLLAASPFERWIKRSNKQRRTNIIQTHTKLMLSSLLSHSFASSLLCSCEILQTFRLLSSNRPHTHTHTTQLHSVSLASHSFSTLARWLFIRLLSERKCDQSERT